MNNEDNSFVLVGVGGAGCRIAAAAVDSFGPGLKALGFDSDALESRQIESFRCSVLGASRLDGRGTGGDRVNGKLAAQDDAQRIREALTGARTVVVVCGLGGGFGGGATPEIIHLAREAGMTTLCFATLPFSFEGAKRRSEADRAVALLEENSDALAVIPLDDLFADANPDGDLALLEATARATTLLADAISVFWRLLLTPGFVRFNPDDLNALLRSGGGRFRFAVSESSDPANRASAAVKAIVGSKLMRGGASLSDSNTIVLGVLGGEDLRLNELSIASSGITSACRQGCALHLGTVLDRRFDGSIRLVALAFENWRASAGDAPEELVVPEQQTPRKSRSRSNPRSKLGFGTLGLGRFRQTAPTMHGNDNLDEPTYLRRGITLPR